MDAAPQRQKRLWLTIGEVAAVAAVIIAGLNYWDAHRQHEAEARRDAAEARQSTLASALTLQGEVQAGGRRLALRAVDPGQVIESQRYVLPREIADHPVDVTAAAAALDADVLAPGLIRRLDASHASGNGRGRVPVAILTSYIAGGQMRRDRSLYLVGYAWRRRFMRGPEITLQGLAFHGRLADADPQAAVDRAWAKTP